MPSVSESDEINKHQPILGPLFQQPAKVQLAARLGIDAADVSTYEQGEKRMSCKLLLETAKQLNARPRFFLQ